MQIDPLTLLAAMGVCVALGIAGRDLFQKHRSAPPEPSPKKQPASEPELEPKKWHPMPCGTRLELEATGYWIELVGKKGRPAYIGYDPEGDAIISGPDLPGMKARLEKHAGYRTEFAPLQVAQEEPKR